MIDALILIFGMLFLGNSIATWTGLPIPGSVIGMILLFTYFVIRRGVPAEVSKHVTLGLGHLSILFIPAGAAIMVHGPTLMAQGSRLFIVLTFSTIIAMVIPGLLLKFLTSHRRTKTQVSKGGEHE